MRGEGQFYSREFSEPVYLTGYSAHAEYVSEFDRGAQLYETAVAFTRPVHEEALTLMQRLLPPAARILDLACGPGTELFRLAELARAGEVVGVDLSADMVAAACSGAHRRELRNTAFFQAEVTNLPQHFAGRFDAVHCSFAFHHFSDPIAALAEMHRVLNRTGKAFVIDGATWWAKLIKRPVRQIWRPWVGRFSYWRAIPSAV